MLPRWKIWVRQYILRMKILWDRKNRKILLSQTINIDKLLVKYVMQNFKKGLLPFRHGVSLSLDHCPKMTKEKDHMKPYAYAMGSLIY